MKDRLQYALAALHRMETNVDERTPLQRVDARAKLLVTVTFLVAMLSLPVTCLSDLLLFAVYPAAMCAWGRVDFNRIAKHSLVVLPLVLFVGVFNPLIDREPMFHVGDVTISRGWVSFAAIVVRGMLSVQAVLLLIYSTGFLNLCRAMRRLHMSAVLTTQLLMLYRYIFVLVMQAQSMLRAITSRNVARRGLTLSMWGTVVGQLLIRTLERAERIHLAMSARGFTGRIDTVWHARRWQRRDTLFVLSLCVALIAVRVFHPVELLAGIVQ